MIHWQEITNLEYKEDSLKITAQNIEDPISILITEFVFTTDKKKLADLTTKISDFTRKFYFFTNTTD